MTCFIAQNLLSELVDEALPSSRAQELQEHLVGCSNCTRELAEIRRVRTLLRSLPVRRAPADFLAKVKAKAEKKSPFEQIARVFEPLIRLPRPAQAGLAFAASLVIAITVFWENGPRSAFDLDSAPGARPAPVSEVANVQPSRALAADDPNAGAQPADTLAGAARDEEAQAKDLKPSLLSKQAAASTPASQAQGDADIALGRRQAEGTKGRGAGTISEVGGLSTTGASGATAGAGVRSGEGKVAYVPPSSPGLYASTPGGPATTPAPAAPPKPQPRLEALPLPAEPAPSTIVESATHPEPAYDASSLAEPQSDDFGGGAAAGMSSSSVEADASARSRAKKEDARSTMAQESSGKRKEASKASTAPAAEAELRDATVASAPAPVTGVSATQGAATAISGKFLSLSATAPTEVVDAARAAGGRLVSPTSALPGLGKAGASTVVIVEIPASVAPAFEEKLRASGTLERAGTLPAEGTVRYRIEVVRQ